MKQLAYSDVPVWLRDSKFYENLSCEEGPDSHIEVPSECFQESDSVDSLEDLADVLKVMGYWGVKCIPLSVLEFCYFASKIDWVSVVLKVTGEGSSEHKALTTFLKSGKLAFSLDAALSTERPEFVIFWLRENEIYCKQNKHAIAQACRYGRLDLVLTLHERGFEWSDYVYCGAAQYGHLHVLEYLHEKGCPLNTLEQIYAACGGQVECMKYLHSIGCPWCDSVLSEFAVPAHYAVLASRANSHIPWTDDYTILPPANAYLECLCYALENGCQISTSSFGPGPCDVASRYGLLDCLEVLCQFKAPCNCTAAAKYGQLDCLKYLHTNGCPIDWYTAEGAATNGHLACLQYLFANGCEGNQQVHHCAAKGDHVDCLRLCIEQDNCRFCVSYLLHVTASANSLACLKYLIEEVAPKVLPYESTILGAALTGGAFACVKYLVDRGCSLTECVYDRGYSKYRIIPPLYDQNLLSCIEYLVERGWQYDRKLYNFIDDFLPLCRRYVEENGWKENLDKKRKIEVEWSY